MPAVASIHIQSEGQGGEATAIIHIGKNYKPPCLPLRCTGHRLAPTANYINAQFLHILLVDRI